MHLQIAKAVFHVMNGTDSVLSVVFHIQIGQNPFAFCSLSSVGIVSTDVSVCGRVPGHSRRLLGQQLRAVVSVARLLGDRLCLRENSAFTAELHRSRKETLSSMTSAAMEAAFRTPALTTSRRPPPPSPGLEGELCASLGAGGCPPVSPHTHPSTPAPPAPSCRGGPLCARGGAAEGCGRCLARRCHQQRGRPRRGPPAPQPARRLPPAARSRFGAGSDGAGAGAGAGGSRPTAPLSRHFAWCLFEEVGNGISPLLRPSPPATGLGVILGGGGSQ